MAILHNIFLNFFSNQGLISLVLEHHGIMPYSFYKTVNSIKHTERQLEIYY